MQPEDFASLAVGAGAKDFSECPPPSTCAEQYEDSVSASAAHGITRARIQLHILGGEDEEFHPGSFHRRFSMLV